MPLRFENLTEFLEWQEAVKNTANRQENPAKNRPKNAEKKAQPKKPANTDNKWLAGVLIAALAAVINVLAALALIR